MIRLDFSLSLSCKLEETEFYALYKFENGFLIYEVRSSSSNQDLTTLLTKLEREQIEQLIYEDL